MSNKVNRLVALTTFLTLAALPLSAAVIDTFTLDMGPTGGGGSTGVLSNVSLDLGTSYIVTVSGTFEIGCISFAPCPTDAEYYVPQGGTNAGLPFTRTGFDAPTGVDIGARINGTKIDWGPFNAARIYSTTFIGLGSQIDVDYLDTNYGDNVGSLEISISTIDNQLPLPAPAAPTLLVTGLGVLAWIRRRQDRTSTRP